jgi:hypothetical protein
MPGGVLSDIGAQSLNTDTKIRASTLLYWTGIAMIAAVILAGLILPLASLLRFVALDPNEGWNALFTRIAMRGSDLYPSPAGTVINNYPPLSFYVVGIVGRLMGDDIFAGRAVALVSMFIVGANIYLWLRAAGSSARAAYLGASLFLAFAVSYAPTYVGMDDPQWLAHALMTGGLVVLWRGNAGTRAILIGSALMLAGGWSKHLLIPLPIATTFWLARRSRPALLTWVGVSAALLAVTGLVVWWLYGGAFFESLHSAREFSRHQATVRVRTALRFFAPLVVLSVLLLPLGRRSERTEFATAYLLVAGAVAVIASGGIGVDLNANFDFMIAACICSALTADAIWQRQLPGALRGIQWGAMLTLLLGVYLGVKGAGLWAGTVRDLRNLDARENETLAAVHLIAEAGGGRAACEMPQLCYWAKSEFSVDFFNYGQRLKVGMQPLTPCEEVFDGRRVALVQLSAAAGHGSGQLPAACNELIQRNYASRAESGLGSILLPR